jgi:Tfp pilus assembly protein PilN
MSTINLLPEDYLQRRRQHRGNMICTVLLGVVIVSICAAAVVREQSTRRTREVCDRMSAAYADAAKLIDEVRQLEKQKANMLDKAKRSAALMERMPRSYLLAMLTNALPEGASLKSVRMVIQVVGEDEGDKPKTKAKAAAVKAPAVQKAPQLAMALSITGKATTDVQVARFIARLAAHPLTDVVDLAYSKESKDLQDKGMREFQLSVILKPDADVLDAIRAGQPDETPGKAPAQLSMGESR